MVLKGSAIYFLSNRYLCGMGRPKTTSESQSQRTVAITYASVEEKQFWQAHAKRRGTSLAALIKILLTEDYEAHPGPPPTS